VDAQLPLVQGIYDNDFLEYIAMSKVWNNSAPDMHHKESN